MGILVRDRYQINRSSSYFPTLFRKNQKKRMNFLSLLLRNFPIYNYFSVLFDKILVHQMLNSISLVQSSNSISLVQSSILKSPFHYISHIL